MSWNTGSISFPSCLITWTILFLYRTCFRNCNRWSSVSLSVQQEKNTRRVWIVVCVYVYRLVTYLYKICWPNGNICSFPVDRWPVQQYPVCNILSRLRVEWYFECLPCGLWWLFVLIGGALLWMTDPGALLVSTQADLVLVLLIHQILFWVVSQLIMFWCRYQDHHLDGSGPIWVLVVRSSCSSICGALGTYPILNSLYIWGVMLGIYSLRWNFQHIFTISEKV